MALKDSAELGYPPVDPDMKVVEAGGLLEFEKHRDFITHKRGGWLRMCTALTGDPSSVSNTHIGQFTIAYNSSSRASDTFLRPPPPQLPAHRLTPTRVHT